MASYAYTANTASAAPSANIGTDKIRIATSNAAIQFTTSFPNVAVTGSVTCATTSPNITGSGTSFTTQLALGYWVGNNAGNSVGIVSTIIDDTHLTLTANAALAISSANLRYNPYGVAYTIANANSSQIPSNTILNSVIVGQGNIVSYLSASGANTIFTITELGMPHASTGTSGITATPSAGGPTNIPVE
jgi:hypothetical protein